MLCCQASVRFYEGSTCSCRYTGVMFTGTNHTYMQRLCHLRFSVTELRRENFSIRRFCENILAMECANRVLPNVTKSASILTWSCILSFGWFPGNWILYAVWELSHLRKWCKPDSLHHPRRWKCSQTSANKIQMLGNRPQERKQFRTLPEFGRRLLDDTAWTC